MSLTLSFDIGYASIGWCVLSSDASSPDPEFLGTGVVTFPTDDCLAKTRRNLRRTRRHIRSTRHRIERIKRWLEHREVLSRADLDRPGHPAPFLLAAAALNGKRILSSWELWTVLRWYAHNRGYDGNSRWARNGEEEEDTEKVQQAHSLMNDYNTETMCETVTACLGLKVDDHDKRISSHLPYKTLNAAYPRSIVEKEVGRLLSLHLGKIPNFDAEAVRLIMKSSPLTKEEREKLEDAEIKLPKRYFGGILFGQLIPRFDNRIISRCPITWAKTYDEATGSGMPDAQARKLADKFAKVPAAKCPEFLAYRLARILANIKADGQPLDREIRNVLWKLAEKNGRLTHSEIEKTIKSHYGEVATNLEAYFKMHPDSEDALILDPVMVEVRKAEGNRAKLSPIWKHLPETVKNETIVAWKAGKAVSLAWMLEQSAGTPNAEPLQAALEEEFTKLKPKRGNPPFADFNSYLLKTVTAAKLPSGRAPYARPVLRQVVSEVLDGYDATKACRATDPENGEDKPENGVLYDLGIPTSRVRQLQTQRPLEKLTNNHLVRHRLLILNRLLDDITAEFASDETEVARVVVEVAREVSQFSGMTAKEIKSELNSRLKDFKGAVSYLEKHAPDLQINGSIIRKCRIAMDLNWQCPFTGEKYDPYMLPKLEREHIIPYATRNTNALHALVLTWPEVNRMKGKRTARQFVIDCAAQPVQNLPRLSIFTLRQFETFVEKLDTKGHPDDTRRKRARKALLGTTSFEDTELGFTDGDLTKTSHLMKLALKGVTTRFPGTACDPIPGSVTGEIRKAWRLTGTLARACPEVVDSDGNILPKDEIRALTHMHHALDAATVALAAHYFPLQARGSDQKGKIWQALLKRRRSPEEKEFLHQLGIFDRYQRVRRDKHGNETTEIDVRLRDLPDSVKEQLSRSLAECRVAQHVPADQSGTKAEQTTWSILGFDGQFAIVLQRINRSLLKIAEGENRRQWENVPVTKEAAKLLKKHANSMTARQRALVSRGILKLTREPMNRLLGPNPAEGPSKLQPHGKGRGAKVIEQNYGIALTPEPLLIPFHKVNQTLRALNMQNSGNLPRILRNGCLINVPRGTWKGTWKITSVKNSEAYGISVDLAAPHSLKRGKGNAKIPDMIRDGLEILPHRYTGHSLNSISQHEAP